MKYHEFHHASLPSARIPTKDHHEMSIHAAWMNPRVFKSFSRSPVHVDVEKRFARNNKVFLFKYPAAFPRRNPCYWSNREFEETHQNNFHESRHIGRWDWNLGRAIVNTVPGRFVLSIGLGTIAQFPVPQGRGEWVLLAPWLGGKGWAGDSWPGWALGTERAARLACCLDLTAICQIQMQFQRCVIAGRGFRLHVGWQYRRHGKRLCNHPKRYSVSSMVAAAAFFRSIPICRQPVTPKPWRMDALAQYRRLEFPSPPFALKFLSLRSVVEVDLSFALRWSKFQV